VVRLGTARIAKALVRDDAGFPRGRPKFGAKPQTFEAEEEQVLSRPITRLAARPIGRCRITPFMCTSAAESPRLLGSDVIQVGSTSPARLLA